MDAPVSIYAMHDTVTDDVYVGATSGPIYFRKATHIHAAYVKKFRARSVAMWIRQVLHEGRDIEIVALEVVPAGDDWQDVERFYVSQFRALGMPLLNERNGGLEAPENTQEIRLKIAAGNMGKKRTPEHIAKWQGASLVANRGKKRSDETRARMRAAWAAKRLTKEQANGALTV